MVKPRELATALGPVSATHLHTPTRLSRELILHIVCSTFELPSLVWRGGPELNQHPTISASRRSIWRSAANAKSGAIT